MTIIFSIDLGIEREFKNIDESHEWANLKDGLLIDIYHSKNKWGGLYKINHRKLLTSLSSPVAYIRYSLQLMNVRLTCTKNKHNKEWSAERKNQTSVICKWGKIGSTLQSKEISFSTVEDLTRFLNDKIDEKLKKGYESKP